MEYTLFTYYLRRVDLHDPSSRNIEVLWKKVVVEKVSVNIKRGKITSFIGPNGAGKSTLLSMVSRLLDADTGEVLVDKKNVKTDEIE